MRLNISNNIISIFILALILQPVFANTELEKAQAFISEGKLQEALSSTDNYLAKDEKNVQARFIKGLILTKMNHFDEAEKIFLGLTKEHPRLPEPYNNLAVIYAAQGEYEKARKVLQEAISTHPSYATAHENIGDIYAKMASRAYNKALQLDEGNQTAREKLSLIGELFSAPISVASQQDEVKPKGQVVAKAKENTTGYKPVKEERTEAAAPKQVVVQEEKMDENEVQKNEALKKVILKAVNDWAKAWSAQEVNNYLGFYSNDFVPPNDLARTSWEELRAERLNRPNFVSVDVIKPTVTLHGNDHASVIFFQSYQSDTYSDQINKTLLMKNVNGRWLIIEERSR